MTALVIFVVMNLAGCAAFSVAPDPPPADFDAQSLVGRWQGEWASRDRDGGATLDITSVMGTRVSGRLSLAGFSGAFEPDNEVEGFVSERGGRVMLTLTTVPPMDLAVTGTLMRGAILSSVPSMQTSVSLRKIL
jgi:hypothetical protein